MRIAQLAPLWKIIPPKKYGGVELVVANLTKGLVGLRHDVTLFACKGSKSPGKLINWNFLGKPYLHKNMGALNLLWRI